MSDTNNVPTPEVTPSTTITPAAEPAPDFKATGSTTATDLRRQLSDVLKHVEGDDSKVVTITRHGKVVAAVIGANVFKLLARLQASVKELAPKLGMTEAALFEKLAAFEPPVGVLAVPEEVKAVELALASGDAAAPVDPTPVTPVAAPAVTVTATPTADAAPSFEG